MSGWQIEDEPYQHWIENVETPLRQGLAAPGFDIENDGSWPRISIVMPTYNSPLTFLRAALDSVLAQSYPKWQLCIADDASDQPELMELLKDYCNHDPRIVLTLAQTGGGIAVTSNRALGLATGQYIAFMDHDDTLSVHALLLIAEQLRRDTTTLLLYTDSDSIDTSGTRSKPFFKPDWNYDLFLGQNYLNHLSVYRSDLLQQLGGLRKGFEGSQDYDLALRFVERINPSQITHLPQILYHWRVLPTAVSQTNLGDAVRSARRAVTEHLQRSELSATVGAPPRALLYNRVNWAAPNPQPTTHIVVYGHDRELIDRSVGDIQAISLPDTSFSVSSVLIALHSPPLPLGEILAEHCTSVLDDNICLIAAGLSPHTSDWLQRLTGIIARSDVGIVAPKMVDTKGTLLSGPLVLGTENWFEGVLPTTAAQSSSRSNDGYFKRLRLDHQVSAVHGACLMIKRTRLKEVAGFNANFSSLPLIGADLCLRMQEKGCCSIWTASVKMQCSEPGMKSVFLDEPDTRELLRFEKAWPQTTQCDPYYNPNFSRTGINHQLPS